jgi:tetrapyrrole methylase family protein/MazG family protein/ATP diphosphatase
MTITASEQLTRLMAIMATLRGPDGCPWDREQTIDTLKAFVLEETYEVIDAIDRHDHTALCEELGDFVFEAVFLAQLESEEGHFTLAESLEHVADKLVRRHPHVFARDGHPRLDTPDQVKVRWEEIKRAERGGAAKPVSLLGTSPPALPALLRAHQLGVRAASVGFDWARADDVVEKIQEEVDEVRDAFANADADRDAVEEEIGDLLFAVANLSRKLGIDPETALRKANDKFTRRFNAMEVRVTGAGRSLADLSLDALESEWERVKATERR